MEAKSGIQFYDLEIDIQDFDNSVMALFSEIRPDWRQEDIKSKTYSEGFVNCMKRFSVFSDEALADAIVVRVHGTALADFVSRDKEFMAMQLGYAAGCAQPILAAFKNGVAYKYAHGRTLTPADLNDPKIIRAAARKLAQLHMLDVKTVHLLDSRGNEALMDTSDFSQEATMQMAAIYQEKMKDPRKDEIFQKYKLPCDELVRDIERTQQLKRKELGMMVCLNHGDFHMRNILYNDATEDVVLVDYELAGYRLEAWDITYLISIRTIFEIMGVVKPEDPYITPEAWQLWLRSYTERKYELKGIDVKSIPEAVFEMVDLEHTIVEICNTLGQMLACGALAESDKFPFVDIIQLLPRARQKWDERKHELPALAERYKQLKESCVDFLS